MSDDYYTETTHTSYLGRVKRSFMGVLFGILMFLGAFPLLFWNEGRSVKTLKALEEGAGAVVPITSFQSSNEGKLVHLTGKVIVNETLSDEDFNLTYNGVALKRVVEMYQWQERTSTRTRKKLGGGEKKVTEYSYKKIWAEMKISSNSFKRPEGHRNPTEWPVHKLNKQARDVSLKGFQLSSSLISKINNYREIRPPEDLPIIQGISPQKSSNTVYYTKSGIGSPEIGDFRVTFKGVPAGNVSLVSRQVGNSFSPYLTSNGRKIELLEVGTRNAELMFAKAKRDNSLLTWGIRIGGFLLMFFGLAMILGPLSTMADLIPMVGSLVGFSTSVVAFALSSTFSLLTIAVAWFFYRPVISGILGAVAGSFIFFLYKKNKELTSQNKEDNKPTPLKRVRRPLKKRSARKSVSSLPDDQFEEVKWFIYGKTKKYGPFTVDEIQNYLNKGKISLRTVCRAEHGSEKISVGKIPQIKASA